MRSRETYQGDGETTVFNVPFEYMDGSLQVYIDGTLVSNYIFPTRQVIQFDVAPESGAVILLKRATNLDERLVVWNNGALLNRDDLEDDSLQGFYTSQELVDMFETAMYLDNDDKFGAQNKIIKDVKDPVDNQDAVTKFYVDSLVTGASSDIAQDLADSQSARDAAINAKTAAELARDQAISARDTANTAASNAVAAQTAAETARDTTQGLIGDANASKLAAKASEDAAALSATNASSSASSASASAVDAATSARNAGLAKDQAIISAGEADQSAINASNSAGAADASADAAQLSATAAAGSAADALTHANNAQLSAEAAYASELKASQWADSEFEVETSRYSAKYWADRAQQITGGTPIDETKILHTQASGMSPVGYSTTEADDRYYQKSEVYTKAEVDALSPTLPPTNISFCFSGLEFTGQYSSPRYLIKSDKTISRVDLLGDAPVDAAFGSATFLLIEVIPSPSSGSVEPTWVANTPIQDGQIIWYHDTTKPVTTAWQPNYAYTGYECVYADESIWVCIMGGTSGLTEPDWASVGEMEPLYDGTNVWVRFLACSTWQPNTSYSTTIGSGSLIVPSSGVGPVFQAVGGGYMSGSVEPTWLLSGTVQDNEVYWQAFDYYETWTAETELAGGVTHYIMPTVPNGYLYSVTPSDTVYTGSTEPVWNTDGTGTTDGAITWELVGRQWSADTMYTKNDIVYPITPNPLDPSIIYIFNDKIIASVASNGTDRTSEQMAANVDSNKIIYVAFNKFGGRYTNVTIQVEMEDR